MGKPLRFSFDTEFAADGSIKPTKEELEAMKEPDLPPEPTFSEEEVAMARQQGYEQGRQEALNESQASLEQQSTAALQAIAHHMQQVAILQHQANQSVRKEAAMLAGEVGRALAGRLLQDEPLAEMEDVINHCIAELGDEPRILIKVAEPVVDVLRDRVGDMAARVGFQGQVLVLGEPALPVGSCQLEWSSGGAERDQRAIEGAVQEALDRFIFSRPGRNERPPEITPEMAAEFQQHQEELEAQARAEAQRLAAEKAAEEAARQAAADAEAARQVAEQGEDSPAAAEAEPEAAMPEADAEAFDPAVAEPAEHFDEQPQAQPQMSPAVDAEGEEEEEASDPTMGFDPMGLQPGQGGAQPGAQPGAEEIEDDVLDPMSMQQPMDAMAQDAMMAAETKENE